MRNLSITEIARVAAGFATDWPGLARRPLWSPERMREWQLKRLRRLVTHAYERVPFYRDLYTNARVRPEDLQSLDDLHRFPIVTKDQIIANYPSGTIARGYSPERLIISRSSGSSGKVLDIAYDTRAMVTFVLAGLRLYRMAFDYRPRHRQVYVYTSPYPMNSLLGMFPMRFVPTVAPVAEILAALREAPVDLLVCYPSHLRHILDAGRVAGVTLRPRAVSTNSEMSTQAERDAMSRELGCPVLDEYSSEELTRIAAQCRHGIYHVFEDINYIEVLDADDRPTDGPGVIVGTNLHNFAMPMIRYRQNDIAQLRTGTCACGWNFRHLQGLQGRKNNSFVMPSGATLTSGFLLDASYEFLLTHRDAVKDFCLIQHAPDRITLEVVTAHGWNETVANSITTRFAKFLEPAVQFTIEPVAVCTKTTSGKNNPRKKMMTRAAR